MGKSLENKLNEFKSIYVTFTFRCYDNNCLPVTFNNKVLSSVNDVK